MTIRVHRILHRQWPFSIHPFENGCPYGVDSATQAGAGLVQSMGNKPHYPALPARLVCNYRGPGILAKEYCIRAEL